MTVEQITDEALALPDAARVQLADRLVESLDPADDSLFRKIWADEARHRLDSVRSGRVRTIPGEEGLEQVRRTLAQRD